MRSVSVIVPARNAAGTLSRALDAIAAQDLRQPYEVVVVDDGSDDDTAATAERASVPVTVIRQPAAGPAAARNRGVAASSGELLAFTDADCFPARSWLRAGVAALETADLVQGAVRPDPQARMEPFDRSLWVVGEHGLYELANLFVSREWFERVGGLQGWLRPEREKELAEDVWFGWRVRRAGGRTSFDPDALVHHAVFPRTMRGYIIERRRLRHFPAITARVPELRSSMFFSRLFLSRRTAAFDLAVLGAVGALVLERRGLLALVGPYGWIAARRALRARRAFAAVAVAEPAADAVGLVSLLVGSAGARSLVI